MSTYVKGKTAKNVTDKDMRKGIKMAAAGLNYPENKNIAIEQVDSHSF